MEFIILALIFALIAAFALFRTKAGDHVVQDVKQVEVKRQEIMEAYKVEMDAVLTPFLKDKDALREQKTRLLQRFSVECSQNIFFGPEEVRQCIRELSLYEVGSKTLAAD